MLLERMSSKQLLMAFTISIGLAATGCHSSDYAERTEKSDSAIITNVPPPASMDRPDSNAGKKNNADSAAMPAGKTDTSAAGTSQEGQDTAKPNAAKKGMKGRATITAPTKGTGAMEMDKSGAYNNVAFLPSFPGGNKGLQKFFDDNLSYPVAATDEGVEGTVNVNFIVDEHGKLGTPSIQGRPLGYGLESEALRVVNKMPSWTPGRLAGRNVKTKFTLPVVFQLY